MSHGQAYQLFNVIGKYFNERLYDLFVGLPYEYISDTGELNYRLKVAYNNNNPVSKNIQMRSPTNPLEIAYTKSVLCRCSKTYLVSHSGTQLRP